MKDPLKYVRKNILALSPYSTARDEYTGDIGIYVDANENPFENGYNRYPDPHQKELKKLISEIKSVPVENIFIGNGSDEAIDIVYRVFCEPGRDNVLSIAPTYGMYKVAAAINDIELKEVQLGEEFALDADKLLQEADSNTKVVFLCSPNNPTGNLLDKEQIKKIIMEFDGVVVLDEAYADFSQEEGFLPLIAEYPNLVVLQTLSKARGLAGLRLGMAFAAKEIVSLFSKVKYPYNINGITQQIVSRELGKDIGGQVEIIIKERDNLLGELNRLDIVKKVYPSDANFILARFDDAKEVYKTLIEGGVIVRDRSSVRGCEGCLRITIGTPEENRKLLKILSEL